MTAAMDPVVHYLRRLATSRAAEALSDGQLLERFVAERDESAFAALLQRHGAMVLRVCRRHLPQAHDAEDAFQAVFLVLAHKAAAVRNRDSLASWLHGVALRVSANLNRGLARIASRERGSLQGCEAVPPPDLSWLEVRAALDEELARLPERYRAPLVLCYLEGKTRDEAAQELGWSLSTLRGRLERGRERLRQRLKRRGLELSAALGAAGLTQHAVAVSTCVVNQTARTAALVAAGRTAEALVSARVATLAQGIVCAMKYTKIKILTAVVLLAGVLGPGSGLVAYSSFADVPQAAAAEPPKVAADPAPQPPLAASAAILSLDFTADGKRLVSADDEKQVTVWDVESAQTVVRLKTRAPIRSLRCSPDGRTVAVTTVPRVEFWNVESGKRAFWLIDNQPFFSVAFAPDGKRLAATAVGPTVGLWDIGAEKVLWQSPCPECEVVAFSSDGKFVAGAAADRTVRLWDATTGKSILRLGEPIPGERILGWPVAFSPDGKQLVAPGEKLVAPGEQHTVRVWELPDGKASHLLQGLRSPAIALAFTPDGKALVTGSSDGIRLWDTTSGRIVRSLGRFRAVTSLAISADGKLLATGLKDGSIHLWDLWGGRPVRTLAGREVTVNNILPPLPLVPPRRATRLDELVIAFIQRGKSDAEAVDAIFLATLARFPTEIERKAAEAALAKKDRTEALTDLGRMLANTQEFRTRLAELGQEGAASKP